jgi:hypothetical protein
METTLEVMVAVLSKMEILMDQLVVQVFLVTVVEVVVFRRRVQAAAVLVLVVVVEVTQSPLSQILLAFPLQKQ